MIYFVQDELSLNIKIGYHGGEDAMARIKSLQTGCSSRQTISDIARGRRWGWL